MDHLVVSDNGIFLMSAHDANIISGDDGQGFYYNDMRHLSGFQLLLNEHAPALLQFSDSDMYQATVLLGNEQFRDRAGAEIQARTIAIRRERAISAALYERITLINYNHVAVTVTLTLDVAADFVDIFLVRGFPPIERGVLAQPEHRNDGLLFAYQGKDDVVRTTELRWSLEPSAVHTAPVAPVDPSTTARLPQPASATVSWEIPIAARAEQALEITCIPATSRSLKLAEAADQTFQAATRRLQASYAQWHDEATQVRTDNPAFNEVLTRSALDLRALVGTYPTGRLPMAGVPWYLVPFGRDSLITSFQTLCFQPELAVGTLRFLAANQGAHDDPWRDETPGKIIHELRSGEYAGVGAVPFTRYFGTVDATMLFLMLFAQTMRWTADRPLYDELFPAVLRALDWIDQYGDLDGDGYVEFLARSERGLSIQGWKDSTDSILRDGIVVEPPIALVEVQAYVYAAKTWIAETLRQMGDTSRAAELETAAARLKAQFNRDFWLPASGFYSQALDREKRPVDDLTSNPGHALIANILPPDRAKQVAERLLQPDMASGWGIRTRGSSDPAYNPMSYHNGSIWPHDNSLILYGLYRSGLRDAATTLATQLFAAAQQFPLMRLPELMCGFGLDSGAADRPVQYPVSCSPQAWAAGTPYLMLQSMLGLEPDALRNRLRVAPHLPPWLREIDIHNLRIGKSRVDLVVTREGVEVVSSQGLEIQTAAPQIE